MKSAYFLSFSLILLPFLLFSLLLLSFLVALPLFRRLYLFFSSFFSPLLSSFAFPPLFLLESEGIEGRAGIINWIKCKRRL